MTREERKRAAALQKNISIYGMGQGAVAKFMFPLTVIADAALMIMFFRADEPFNAGGLLYFNAMLFLITLILYPGATHIGDTGALGKNMDNAASALGGTMYGGKFLCTLPFQAKDIMNMRLINFEKQMCLHTILAVALHITTLIAGSMMGSQTYDSVSGAITAFYLTAEILMLIVSLSRFSIYSYMILWPLLGFSGIFIEYVMPDTAEEAAEFCEKFGFLSVFSGVSGIIIVIAFAVVLAIAGEFYLKKKNGVSWNLY